MGAVSPRPILVKSHSPGSPSGSSGEKSSPITKLSISKNYVIPPRPKPGRKPSNDIPPSRRKAQNRDAQRAFRERKSQAVRALEEQLAKQTQEFERQQSVMREQILLLQKQNMQIHHTSPSSPPQFGSPSQIVQPNSGSPGAMSSGLPSATQSSSASSSPGGFPGVLPNGIPIQPQTMISMLSPVQLRPLMSPGSQQYTMQPMSPQPIKSPQSPGSPFGTPVTPADVAGLELLDHVLEQKLPVEQQQQQQQQQTSPAKLSRRASRSSKTSPESPQSPGVIRVEPPAAANPLDLVNTKWSQPAVPLRRKSKALEVDFTMAFTPRSPRPLVLPSPPALKDRCGFCTDNTPCICAASAAREEGADIAPDLATLGSPLGSPIGSPLGSSDNNLSSGGTSLVSSHVRRRSSLSQSVDHSRSLNADSSGGAHDEAQTGACTGNPGSCSQCRQDPMLTLFCSAVANKVPALRMPALGTFIPAQAAYKTLSRHPRFAYADLGEVVNLLLVKSSQIEVNSVAKVLRILDTK